MRGLRRLRARTVIVTTRQPDDRSIRGVLTGLHRDCLVLTHATYLAEATRAPMGGEVLIPREQVAYVQTVDATRGEA